MPDVRPGPVRVALTTVTNDVLAPVAGITAAGQPTHLYVVDQVGFLWDVPVGNRAQWPVGAAKVLDVTDLVVGPSRDGDERGFLGAAFSPGFASDRRSHKLRNATRRKLTRTVTAAAPITTPIVHGAALPAYM